MYKTSTDEIRNDQGSMDMSSKEMKKSLNLKIYSNLIDILLLLDGIIMINIELAGVFEFLADNVGV